MLFFHSTQHVPHLQRYTQLECWDWIERVLGRQLPGNDLPSVLKDGCILCELVNTMFNGVIKIIHPPDSQPYELRDVCFSSPNLPKTLFFNVTEFNFFHRTLHNFWTF